MLLNTQNIRTFRRLIKEWGRRNLRDYPWRQTSDPYRVLLAELMLRRTQADQVVPVYKRFLERYPDCKALCEAAPDSIRDLMVPLGLKWRADNVVDLAHALGREFSGEVPREDRELRKLPGVGNYVSATVRCFALGEAVPVIDTNTVRIVGRIFGLAIEGEARRRAEMIRAISRCVDPREPRLYNLALIDFGAAICQSRGPHHAICPFAKWRRCTFYAQTRGP